MADIRERLIHAVADPDTLNHSLAVYRQRGHYHDFESSNVTALVLQAVMQCGDSASDEAMLMQHVNDPWLDEEERALLVYVVACCTRDATGETVRDISEWIRSRVGLTIRAMVGGTTDSGVDLAPFPSDEVRHIVVTSTCKADSLDAFVYAREWKTRRSIADDIARFCMRIRGRCSGRQCRLNTLREIVHSDGRWSSLAEFLDREDTKECV